MPSSFFFVLTAINPLIACAIIVGVVVVPIPLRLAGAQLMTANYSLWVSEYNRTCSPTAAGAFPWGDAVSRCAALGQGYLPASFGTTAAYGRYKSLVITSSQQSSSWIGLSDQHDENNFYWQWGRLSSYEVFDNSLNNRQTLVHNLSSAAVFGRMSSSGTLLTLTSITIQWNAWAEGAPSYSLFGNEYDCVGMDNSLSFAASDRMCSEKLQCAVCERSRCNFIFDCYEPNTASMPLYYPCPCTCKSGVGVSGTQCEYPYHIDHGPYTSQYKLVATTAGLTWSAAINACGGNSFHLATFPSQLAFNTFMAVVGAPSAVVWFGASVAALPSSSERDWVWEFGRLKGVRFYSSSNNGAPWWYMYPSYISSAVFSSTAWAAGEPSGTAATRPQGSCIGARTDRGNSGWSDNNCNAKLSYAICERSACQMGTDCHPNNTLQMSGGAFYPDCTCVCRKGWNGAKCDNADTPTATKGLTSTAALSVTQTLTRMVSPSATVGQTASLPGTTTDTHRRSATGEVSVTATSTQSVPRTGTETKPFSVSESDGNSSRTITTTILPTQTLSSPNLSESLTLPSAALTPSESVKNPSEESATVSAQNTSASKSTEYGNYSKDTTATATVPMEVDARPPIDSTTSASLTATVAAATASAASALDIQTSSLISISACANPTKKEAEGLYRALSPVALSNSCAGVVQGGALLVGLCIALPLLAAVIFKQIRQVASWPTALGQLRTPSIAFMAAGFVVNSIAVCGAEYLHAASASASRDFDMAAGAVLIAVCVLFVVIHPIISHLFGTRRYSTVAYNRGEWPCGCSALLGFTVRVVFPQGYFDVPPPLPQSVATMIMSSFDDTSTSLHLMNDDDSTFQNTSDSGADAPARNGIAARNTATSNSSKPNIPPDPISHFRDAPQALSAIVGPYRRPSCWCSLLGIASAVVSWPCLIPPRGTGGCSAAYWVSAVLHFLLAIAVVALLPRRTILSDVTHAVALVLNGALVALAAAGMSDAYDGTGIRRGDSSGDDAHGGEAISILIGYLLVGVTVVRGSHACIVGVHRVLLARILPPYFSGLLYGSATGGFKLTPSWEYVSPLWPIHSESGHHLQYHSISKNEEEGIHACIDGRNSIGGGPLGDATRDTTNKNQESLEVPLVILSDIDDDDDVDDAETVESDSLADFTSPSRHTSNRNLVVGNNHLGSDAHSDDVSDLLLFLLGDGGRGGDPAVEEEGNEDVRYFSELHSSPPPPMLSENVIFMRGTETTEANTANKNNTNNKRKSQMEPLVTDRADEPARSIGNRRGGSGLLYFNQGGREGGGRSSNYYVNPPLGDVELSDRTHNGPQHRGAARRRAVGGTAPANNNSPHGMRSHDTSQQQATTGRCALRAPHKGSSVFDDFTSLI